MWVSLTALCAISDCWMAGMIAPTISCQSAACIPRSLPPDLVFDVLGEVFVVGGPELGAEVLPTAVGEEADDVAGVEALGGALGGLHDGAGGDAGEDSFLLRQLLRRSERRARLEKDLAVEDALVEDGRDEALFEAAEALHEIAGVRDGGDDLHAGLLLFQVAAGAGKRAACAHAGDEHVDLGKVAEDFGAGGLVVGARVHLVAVLVRHPVRRILGGDLLRLLDGAVRAARAIGVHDLRAVRGEQLRTLRADAFGDDDLQAIALDTADHGQGDAGVTGAGLEDDAVLREDAGALRLLDHVFGDAVFDAAAGVLALELGVEAHAGLRRHAGHLDDGRVADGFDDVVIEHVQPVSLSAGQPVSTLADSASADWAHAPPARAGRMEMESPSFSLVLS